MATPWDLEEHMLPGIGAPAPAPEMSMPQGSMPERYPTADQQSYVYPGSGLSDDNLTLDAEYHAAHADNARHELAKLDKAAKFRRALSMITETFATITGRPDMAAMARERIVREDQARAEQANAKILAHVGVAALDRERRKRDASMNRLEAMIENRAARQAKSIMDSPGLKWNPDVPQHLRNYDSLREHIVLTMNGLPGIPELARGFTIDPDVAVGRSVDKAVKTVEGITPIKEDSAGRLIDKKSENDRKMLLLRTAASRRLIEYRKQFPAKPAQDLVDIDVKRIVGDRKATNGKKLRELSILRDIVSKRGAVPKGMLDEIEKLERLVADDVARQTEAQARSD